MAVVRGALITLEGVEGAGKSVQARYLKSHLEQGGARVQLVREPGGTPLGERVRDVLLFARDVQLSPEAQALLFSAARAQLTREVIAPALEAGVQVIADRFFDSTLAYQGFGHGADLEGLRSVTRFAIDNVVPDLTALLDLPVHEALQRARKRSERWDRFEADEEAFHRRVRGGYLALAEAEPARFFVVNAELSEVEVARQIATRVDEVLRARSSGVPTSR